MKNFFTLTLCFFTLSLTAQESGCTYQQADNYSSTATVDNGTCVFGSGLCGAGTMWNSELELCEITNPTDSNFDGCTGLNDLLNLLAVYGDCSNNDCGNTLHYQGYDYATVQIGEQCWFAENLITEFSQNGEYIENVNQPDWPTYNLESYQYSCIRRVLSPTNTIYSWQCTQTTNEVCPSGWHSPTDSDFQTLFEYVDQEFVWSDNYFPNSTVIKSIEWGDNLTGFNLKPYGRISDSGEYQPNHWYYGTPLATIWTSNNDHHPSESFHGGSRIWLNEEDDNFGGSAWPNEGSSARCVKD